MTSIVSFQVRRILTRFTFIQAIGHKKNCGCVVGQHLHIQFMCFWKSMTIHVKVTLAWKATFACKNHVYIDGIFFLYPYLLCFCHYIRATNHKTIALIHALSNKWLSRIAKWLVLFENDSFYSKMTHSIRKWLVLLGQNSIHSQNDKCPKMSEQKLPIFFFSKAFSPDSPWKLDLTSWGGPKKHTFSKLFP